MSAIGKWGNSPALRLPRSIMAAANFSLDQKVNMSVKNGKLIIEKQTEESFALDQLVAGINSENLHAEADFGQSVGKELL